MVNDKMVNKPSKVMLNKNEKLQKLLDTAFNLFTDKGIKHTSIQDIVDNAGVAKGTFYLYFKDKYEIQNHLLVRTSSRIFESALKATEKENFTRLDDEIVFIVNYIIDYLISNPVLLNFIQKNLSLGLYSEKISELIDSKEFNFESLFLSKIEKYQLDIKHPKVTLYMIIELVSSTVFSSIVKEQPLPIQEYKPILYETIKKIIDEK